MDFQNNIKIIILAIIEDLIGLGFIYFFSIIVGTRWQFGIYIYTYK